MSTVEVRNLVLYKQSGGKKRIPLIKNLGTLFESGKINAIMGPNGSSKTTFLDVLYGVCDQSTETSGSILYNGKERKAGEWFSSVSYSEQDYCMMDDQTVMDAIRFSMSMCHGIEECVEELIKNLHLEKVADSKINVISGGERKRAMMAISMAMGRKILILDEPTSDLDSRLAYSVTRYLKNLAIRHDMMVIMTVHQPSPKLFDIFDNLLFMYDGMQVYSGPAPEVVETMASKGIVQPRSWTTAEFLFEVFGDVSSFEEVEALRPHINSYIRELSTSWMQNTAGLCKKNGAMQYPRIESKHVWLLAKRQFLRDLASRYFFSRTLMITVISVWLMYSTLSKEIEVPSKIAGVKRLVNNPLRSIDPNVILIQTVNLFRLLETLKVFYLVVDASSMLINKPQLMKEVTKSLYNPLALCISTVAVEVASNVVVAVLILAGILILSHRMVTAHLVAMVLCQAIFFVPTALLMRLLHDRVSSANAIAGKVFAFVKIPFASIMTCSLVPAILMILLPRAKTMAKMLMWVIFSICPVHLMDMFMMATIKAKAVDQIFDGDLAAAADTLGTVPSDVVLGLMQWSSIDPRWLLYGFLASLALVSLLVPMLLFSCFSPSVRLRMSRE